LIQRPANRKNGEKNDGARIRPWKAMWGSDLGIHAKLRHSAFYSPEWEKFTWSLLMVESVLAFRR
jgi:hypothetical protein